MATICEMFEYDYNSLYKIIIAEYEKETGGKIKPYKDYEPELLIKFCENYSDENDILSQISKLLSSLIIVQALPNANHRTAFRFVSIYLLKTCGEKMKTYFEEKDLYDDFYRKSKPIIDFEINHDALFNNNYIDAHHSMGIKSHLKYSKEPIEKIVPPQSGMADAVPLQRFISSLNHSS